ncbi:MAG: hypothetical protein AB7P76_08935 [Candidatus Melainabacteria bacterium]
MILLQPGVSLYQQVSEEALRYSKKRQAGIMVRDLSRSLYEHHSVLKKNAFIISSLILVITRVLIAQNTARKARRTNDTEAGYRQQEAMKTTVRELGGFTFSFALLRTVESFVKRQIRHGFSLKKDDTIMKHLRTQAWRVLKKGQEYVPYETYSEVGLRSISQHSAAAWKAGEWYSRLRLDTICKALGWGSVLSESGAIVDFNRMLNRTHTAIFRIVPVLAGMVTAGTLSGYALEKITRDHYQDLANFTRGFLGRKDAARPNKLPSDSRVMTPGEIEYRAYISAIAKQRNRSALMGQKDNPFTPAAQACV